jgi:FkbM family methyltransferase
LLQGHWYELGLLKFLRELQVSGTYVDVGAYVGTFSLYAAMFCRADHVFAFEPQAESFIKLRKNLDRNLARNRRDCCHAWNYALADAKGRGRIVGGPPNRGGATLHAGDEIDVDTLDSFEFSNVTVLKIDAENSELAVLHGATNTLATVRHLFIETWPASTCKAYGIPYHGGEIERLLSDAGFTKERDFGGDTFYWGRADA